ncbi:MAG: hypothetical protein NT154_13660 [Verrucomicrobia bacterium]|nr:hypothetical protein [Verrucomicrobiota bacterium]
MIDSKQLLTALQKSVTLLEDDLRARCNAQAEVDAPLRKDYDTARDKGRTGLTYNAWRDEELTQIAVAWILAGVFVRFLEDNELIDVPFLADGGKTAGHEGFLRPPAQSALAHGADSRCRQGVARILAQDRS